MDGLGGKTLPSETPIDDISGLRIKGIVTRAQLNAAEAENILKATVKYFGGRPSRRTARFDLDWMLKLHREMFGKVWTWAGEIRSYDLNLGILANILLKQNRSPIIEWPEEVIGTESTIRGEYLAAIKEADNGNDQPLLALHRRFLGC